MSINGNDPVKRGRLKMQEEGVEVAKFKKTLRIQSKGQGRRYWPLVKEKAVLYFILKKRRQMQGQVHHRFHCGNVRPEISFHFANKVLHKGLPTWELQNVGLTTRGEENFSELPLQVGK